MSLEFSTEGLDLVTGEMQKYLCTRCNLTLEHFYRNKYVCQKCNEVFTEKIVF